VYLEREVKLRQREVAAVVELEELKEVVDQTLPSPNDRQHLHESGLWEAVQTFVLFELTSVLTDDTCTLQRE
jgi:hypothetical protein